MVQALWETDATGQVHIDSPSWHAYTGQSRQQWLSAGWVQTVHPDEQAFAHHQWQQALFHHTEVNANFRLQSPDGGWRWTNVRTTPIVNADGQLQKWVGMAMDISEQKQTETVFKKSLSQLHLATDAAQAGWGTWDFKTGESDWDERGKQIIGFADPAESKMAQGWLQRVHPDDLEQVNQHIAQCLAQDRDFGLDYRVIRADGQTRLIRASGRFAKAPDGTPLTGTGLVVDITQAAQTEMALRHNEERQAFLLKLSDALRSLADPIAIQQVVTQTTRDYFGADHCYYCVVEAGNAIIHQEVRRPDLPSVIGVYPLSQFPFFRTLVDGGHPFVVANVYTSALIDEELIRQCTPLQVISFIAVPLNKNGQAVGILFLSQSTPRDWTELEVTLVQETAERTWDAVERAKAEEALRQANRRKDEFLAMLAHELRNPLAPIHNGLQALTMTQSNDPIVTGLLPIMNRQMEHLVRLVDHLLDVSRISRGKIDLRKELVDLRQIINEAIDAIRPQYASAHRQLTSKLPAFPVKLNGDATRLHQVIVNLLTNGLRYTHETGQVWLSLEQVGQEAVLRVGDNGIGLAADQLQAIFELFVQVDMSQTRLKGGLGLGLALVRQIVDMHGGRVEAYSAGLEKGSEFVVHLPLSLFKETPSR